MRLRQAIKIMQAVENCGVPLRWKRSTMLEARRICERHQEDLRVPWMPSEEEAKERFGWMMSILGDVLIDDEQKREEYKEQLWAELG